MGSIQGGVVQFEIVFMPFPTIKVIWESKVLTLGSYIALKEEII